MKKHVAVWLDRSGMPFALKAGHGAALSLASASGATIMVTAILAVEKDEVLAGSVPEELARYGAGRLVLLRLGKDGMTGPETLAAALAWSLGQPIFADRPVTDIIGVANAAGRDCMARVAALLRAPLLQDCIAVDFAASTGEKYLLQGRTCGVYALPGPVNCWSLRPHDFSRAAPEPGLSPVAAETVDLAPPDAKASIRQSIPAGDGGAAIDAAPLARMWVEQPDIMEAPVIISGGRSLESAEHFHLLHETAASLHAAVGASRSAVDMGYAPPFVQVGQTGVVVSPELYIACGISGSIFHTTGIKGARTVVAVNTDASAPIFLRADYGITDDLFIVLPILRKILESSVP